MKNLNATLDFFQISVDKVILNVAPGTTLNQCLQTGSPVICNLITRDRFGTLWALPTAQIEASNVNLGRFKTSGADIGVNHAQKIGAYGALKTDFTGTYVKEFKQEPIPGLGTFDCVGLHGATCGVPQPKWRHKLRGTWETPWSVDLALTWRHFGKVNAEGTSTNPLLAGTVQAADQTLSERNYIDLALSWAVTKKITLRGGVNNVFDKDPPVSGVTSAVFGNGNTYPVVYDALGRRVFVNLTATF
jgi:iron complex outermembrane recepter protein